MQARYKNYFSSQTVFFLLLLLFLIFPLLLLEHQLLKHLTQILALSDLQAIYKQQLGPRLLKIFCPPTELYTVLHQAHCKNKDPSESTGHPCLCFSMGDMDGGEKRRREEREMEGKREGEKEGKCTELNSVPSKFMFTWSLRMRPCLEKSSLRL